MNKQEYIQTLELFGASTFSETDREENILHLREELHRLNQIDNPTEWEEQEMDRLYRLLAIEVGNDQQEAEETLVSNVACGVSDLVVSLKGDKPVVKPHKVRKPLNVMKLLQGVQKLCKETKTRCIIVNTPKRSQILQVDSFNPKTGASFSQVMREERSYLTLNRHDTDWSPEHKDGWEITERRNGCKVDDHGNVIMDSSYDG